MRINATQGTNALMNQAGIGKEDAFSRNIKAQIASAQKELQELAADTKMGFEEKIKKRQEIQMKIAELNNQLRQHEIEQQNQKRQKQSPSMEDMLGGTGKSSGQKGSSLSQASMKAIISADSAVGQVQEQNRVTTQMKGKARVLKAEIKQDAGSADTTEKEEELAKTEENIVKAQASQISTLSKANKEMEEAAKVSDTEEDKKEDNVEKIEKNGKEKTEKSREEKTEKSGEGNENEISSDSVSYTHVDVKL